MTRVVTWHFLIQYQTVLFCYRFLLLLLFADLHFLLDFLSLSHSWIDCCASWGGARAKRGALSGLSAVPGKKKDWENCIPQLSDRSNWQQIRAIVSGKTCSDPLSAHVSCSSKSKASLLFFSSSTPRERHKSSSNFKRSTAWEQQWQFRPPCRLRLSFF